MRLFTSTILAAVGVLCAGGADVFAATPNATAPAPAAAAPKLISRFGDWRTATHEEAGQNVCYAYVVATAPTPGRGQVSLTVTQRPAGPRDAVAVSPGFAYANNAAVAVAVDGAPLEFYTAQRSAFARDGRAAIAAFLKGKTVTVRSPDPKAGAKGGPLTDSFSLKGFSDAYKAINKACPPK